MGEGIRPQPLDMPNRHVLYSSLLQGLRNKPRNSLFTDSKLPQDFVQDVERAKRWQGLRQDSGDPFVFAPEAKKVYKQLGIDYTTKTIVYSDALDVDKCLELREHTTKLGLQRTHIMHTHDSPIMLTCHSSCLRHRNQLHKRFPYGFFGR